MSVAHALAERAERASTSGWFVVGFNAAIAGMAWLSGVDAANIFISIVTADLVLLIGIAASRREEEAQRRDKALHAKIDELVSAVAGARDELVHVEDRTEREIEEVRV